MNKTQQIEKKLTKRLKKKEPEFEVLGNLVLPINENPPALPKPDKPGQDGFLPYLHLPDDYIKPPTPDPTPEPEPPVVPDPVPTPVPDPDPPVPAIDMDDPTLGGLLDRQYMGTDEFGNPTVYTVDGIHHAGNTPDTTRLQLTNERGISQNLNPRQIERDMTPMYEVPHLGNFVVGTPVMIHDFGQPIGPGKVTKIEDGRVYVETDARDMFGEPVHEDSYNLADIMRGNAIQMYDPLTNEAYQTRLPEFNWEDHREPMTTNMINAFLTQLEPDREFTSQEYEDTILPESYRILLSERPEAWESIRDHAFMNGIDLGIKGVQDNRLTFNDGTVLNLDYQHQTDAHMDFFTPIDEGGDVIPEGRTLSEDMEQLIDNFNPDNADKFNSEDLQRVTDWYQSHIDDPQLRYKSDIKEIGQERFDQLMDGALQVANHVDNTPDKTEL